MKNQNDISKFISQRNKETAKQREGQKKDKEARRVLQGGDYTGSYTGSKTTILQGNNNRGDEL